MLERTGYENGVLRSYKKYDHAGNLILDIYYLRWIEVDGEPCRNEYEYDENGWLTSKKTYYFDKLSTEYIPIYETVTVTKEQAESIEKANRKYYYLPDPNC